MSYELLNDYVIVDSLPTETKPGGYLEPSNVLTEQQMFDIAYQSGTVPTSETPTYKVTAYAPSLSGIPWWVWLLLALVGVNILKDGSRRKK